MIDFFDKLYAGIRIRNPYLRKLRYYAFLQRCVLGISDRLLPVFLRQTQDNPAYCLPPVKKNEGRIIVSFTSFPKRIGKVWMVVESILRQRKKPDMIILWLSRKQFPSIDTLPDSLLEQRKRGLKIELRDGEDIRSHKKFYYAMQEYPDDMIITIDDDVYYRSDTIELLYQTHLKYPQDVCANLTRVLKFQSDKLALYDEWPWGHETDNHLMSSQIGQGGVLYPPNVLYEDVLNLELLLKLAPLADDMWLFAMGRLRNTHVIYTGTRWTNLAIPFTANETLADINDGLHYNDKQIDAIRTYYMDKLGIDPFAEFAND